MPYYRVDPSDTTGAKNTLEELLISSNPAKEGIVATDDMYSTTHIAAFHSINQRWLVYQQKSNMIQVRNLSIGKSTFSAAPLLPLYSLAVDKISH